MTTDEKLAKDFLNKNWIESEAQVYIAGLQKGRELEAEKAMKFVEFMSNYRYFPWRGWIKADLSSDVNYKAEELYNSEEFKDYLKQFEK